MKWCVLGKTKNLVVAVFCRLHHTDPKHTLEVTTLRSLQLLINRRALHFAIHSLYDYDHETFFVEKKALHKTVMRHPH